MSAKKSKCWNYFCNLKNKQAKCNLCSAVVASSGGTTNLITHLHRHHNIALSKRSETTLASGDVVPQPAEPMCETKAHNITINPWTLSASQRKLPLPRSNDITTAVLNYIVHDLRPFSTIESPVFRKMLSTLEPRHQPPNRTRVSEELIPALYESVKSKLYAELQSSEAVSLTCDGWTSRATQSFLTVTCHFINKNWELSSKILQTEHFEGSHTGQRVGLELKTVMKDWGISDKIEVITVDNASNLTVAVEVSGADLKLGCFAHTLNLASNKALGIPSLDKILGIVRSVVTYFHKSNIATEILKEKQVALQLPKHKLIMDCKTRWNSTYQLLQRFLEQRPAILATLLDDRVKRADKTRVVSGLCDSDIQICEEFVSNMDVMLTATLVLYEEKSPTAGLVLPLLNKLTDHFKAKATDSTFVKSLKNAVGSNLITRYTDPSLRYFLEEASALDPRTKNKACVDEETWGRIEDKMTVLDVTGVAVKTESEDIPHTLTALVDSPLLPALPPLDEDTNANEKNSESASSPPAKI